MLTVDFLSRFLHVFTAITLVGGSLFTLLVLMPAAKAISDEAHRTLATAIQTRWQKFVHLGILLFLVTGFYNFFRAIPLHRGDGLYHALVGVKILLALGIFFIASALVGRSAKLQPMRDARGKWLGIMLCLSVAVVMISSFVKVRGIPNPNPDAVSGSVSAAGSTNSSDQSNTAQPALGESNS